MLTSRKSEAKKQKKKIKVNQTSDARELIVGIESLQLLPTSSNLALFKTTQDCLTFYFDLLCIVLYLSVADDMYPGFVGRFDPLFRYRILSEFFNGSPASVHV